jgi:hypothetical protein
MCFEGVQTTGLVVCDCLLACKFLKCSVDQSFDNIPKKRISLVLRSLLHTHIMNSLSRELNIFVISAPKIIKVEFNNFEACA